MCLWMKLHVQRIEHGDVLADEIDADRCTCIFRIRIDVCQYASRTMPTTPCVVAIDQRTLLPVLDCAPLLSGAPLDEGAAAQLAAALRVLADPGRLRILSLIRAQPSREACVCHLTDALGLSQPTVSHHLRVLYQAGLLARQKRGNWVYYRAVDGALDGLRAALGDAPTLALSNASP
jgi:ArsR family transcriptional regulator